MRHQAGPGRRALRQLPPGADQDQGELRRPGGDRGDQGHLQEVPRQVRDHHLGPLREPRQPRRAGGQGLHDLDHRRVLRADRQQQRLAGVLFRNVPRGAGHGAAAAADRDRQAVPQVPQRLARARGPGAEDRDGRVHQPRPARPWVHVLEDAEQEPGGRQAGRAQRAPDDHRRVIRDATPHPRHARREHINAGVGVPRGARGLPGPEQGGHARRGRRGVGRVRGRRGPREHRARARGDEAHGRDAEAGPGEVRGGVRRRGERGRGWKL
mmetsp:Transcript_31161/g.87772  ORF Transcript_31161/g.87772 Transcript_31161/m.87772 type:complete len:268 (+) Transcript_31161:1266-2069(+)